MYKKAREGIIPNFTGVSDPYEVPENAELVLDTGTLGIQETVDRVIEYMVGAGILSSAAAVSAPEFGSIYDESAADADHHESLVIESGVIENLHVLADGWAGRLQNFMSEIELLQCLHYKTLTIENETFLHSVPITLPVSNEDKERCDGKAALTLRNSEGVELAIIDNPVFYANRKEEICARVFGCMSDKHPKAELILAEGDWCVTGSKLRVLKKIVYGDGLDEYRLTPHQIKDEAKARGADVVYGFQLRNPLHNGHIMLLEKTREDLIAKGYKNPVLLLHPCGGWTKDDDVPLDVRMHQH
jgi:3'-phosphoadenosine 5'-phosphosulfate synthase